MIQPVPAANRSIEISSPRLHCGRAANYGSTIITLLDLRVMQVPPTYQCTCLCRIQMDSRSPAKGCTGIDVILFSMCTGIEMPFTLKDAFENTFCSNFQIIFQKIFCKEKELPEKAAPFTYYVVVVT